ncbi:MAG TPA: RibD family protein [Trebonia sp.]|nr:RibD family protein [Trebonia sp.]
MPSRPYTVLSCAVSVDGYLDDASSSRLILSGPEDLDEVDEFRAAVDAILVGAGTIRADNPRLLVRSPSRVASRVARGRPAHPRRVTLTSSGSLSPQSRFFTGPGQAPLVYCPASEVSAVSARLGAAAEVVSAGEPSSLAAVLSDLSASRSLYSVLIEAGSRLLREALAGNLADELRLAVAPFFVGSPAAPRFALPGRYPHDAAHPMRLAAARQVGSVAVLHYILTDRERPPGFPSFPPLA